MASLADFRVFAETFFWIAGATLCVGRRPDAAEGSPLENNFRLRLKKEVRGRKVVDGAVNEAYFSAVARASQDVMRILTLDGRVEHMNIRGLELLEISSFDNNRGRYWTELWPSASRRKLLRALKRARSGSSARFTAFCPTAGGKARWWSTIVSPITDDKGDVVRLLATSRDITAARRREERLTRTLEKARRAEKTKTTYLAYLKDALDALPAGLAIYDADDRLVVWNRRYVLAGGSGETDSHLKVGRSFADLLRRGMRSGLIPSVAGQEKAWLAQRVDEWRQAKGVVEQRLSDGRCYSFENRRLSDGGMVAIALDITDHKNRTEALVRSGEELARAKVAAESANDAKSVFLANMSHEIRTPLNGVVAMADMLLRSPLQPQDQDMVQVIRNSAQDLERLLSDILDIARVEAGQISLDDQPFHLGEAVRATAALSRQKADEKGIVLQVEIDDAADRSFCGDSGRVRQILRNLVSNAVKFTERGEVRISAERNEAGAVVLRVRDTGIGFAAGEAVFKRFEQIDASITRRFGGAGLGLAISRDLATAMGGSLECRSAPGQGSEFWTVLPLVEVRDAHASEEPAPQAERSLRVLVADDHPTNLKVMSLILGEAQAEAVLVADGAEAVEAFKTQVFDVVLMDMQMPVMDGLSAVRAIRAWEVQHSRRRTPIMMVTANALPEHAAAATLAGADHHLAKPVTAAKLLQGIALLLSEEAGLRNPGPDGPETDRAHGT